MLEQATNRLIITGHIHYDCKKLELSNNEPDQDYLKNLMRQFDLIDNEIFAVNPNSL